MALKKGNAKAGVGSGAAKMGGPGMKPGKPFGAAKGKSAPMAPSDNDGDEGPAFKRGGSVKSKGAKSSKKGCR